MNAICPNCGKNANSQILWQSNVFHTEWNGQPVYYNCYCNMRSAEPLAAQALANSYKYANVKASDVNWKTCNKCTFSKRTIFQYLTEEKWDCSKFGFEIDKLSKAENCTSYITQKDYEKKCLNGEMDKEKERIQVILDFSSLKDIMTKGGIVMSAYKCPHCSAMVNVPEAGKVLICQHCGTSIHPIDIFEKIKSLIG